MAKKPSMAAQKSGRPPPKTTEPLASHIDSDAREMAASRSLKAMFSFTGTIEALLSLWVAPTLPNDLNCSASRGNGLPALEPAAAPRIAVDLHTATVDHASSKLCSARSR